MSIFQHRIASGDPLHDRVILRTRGTVPHQNDVEMKWEIAENENFVKIMNEESRMPCGESMRASRNSYEFNSCFE